MQGAPAHGVLTCACPFDPCNRYMPGSFGKAHFQYAAVISTRREVMAVVKINRNRVTRLRVAVYRQITEAVLMYLHVSHHLNTRQQFAQNRCAGSLNPHQVALADNVKGQLPGVYVQRGLFQHGERCGNLTCHNSQCQVCRVLMNRYKHNRMVSSRYHFSAGYAVFTNPAPSKPLGKLCCLCDNSIRIERNDKVKP